MFIYLFVHLVHLLIDLHIYVYICNPSYGIFPVFEPEKLNGMHCMHIQITPITRPYGRYILSSWGYKPTNITARHHIVEKMLISPAESEGCAMFEIYPLVN